MSRAIAVAMVCIGLICGCHDEPSSGPAATSPAARRGHAGRLEDLAFRMAFAEDADEAERAGIDFANEAGPTRFAFEAFLVAYRRDRPVVVSAAVSPGHWARRHRGRLEFLEDDLNSADLERRLLAGECLGKLDSDVARFLADQNYLSVWVFSATVAGGEVDVDGWVLPPEKQAELLGRGIRLPYGETVTLQALTDRVAAVTGLPVLWYPSPANPKVVVSDVFPVPDEAGIISKIRAIDVLSHLAIVGRPTVHTANPERSPLKYVIMATRTCILMVGIPEGRQGTGNPP